jgi:hypothetical protein
MKRLIAVAALLALGAGFSAPAQAGGCCSTCCATSVVGPPPQVIFVGKTQANIVVEEIKTVKKKIVVTKVVEKPIIKTKVVKVPVRVQNIVQKVVEQPVPVCVSGCCGGRC